LPFGLWEHQSGTVLDVVAARRSYPIQHEEPVAGERRAKQAPQSTPFEPDESENQERRPQQRQKEAYFDSCVYGAGFSREGYSEAKEGNEERNCEQ